LAISAAVSSVAHAVVVHRAHAAIVCRVAPKNPHTQPKTWHRAAGGLQADNSWQQGGVNHKKRDQNLRRATVGHRAVFWWKNVPDTSGFDFYNAVTATVAAVQIRHQPYKSGPVREL